MSAQGSETLPQFLPNLSRTYDGKHFDTNVLAAALQTRTKHAQLLFRDPLGIWGAL
jgi:hypothetical protein